MRLKLPFFIIVNVLIAAIGVICTQQGVISTDATAKPLLQSIGIGLLAAAAVNILDHVLTLEPPVQPVQRIEVVAEKRTVIPESISELKYSAKKVDMIGVSLNHFLDELAHDSRQTLITRLLKHNLQLRIFLVDPSSKYLQQRAVEDNQDPCVLVERQKAAVRHCMEFYDQLLEAYEALGKAEKLNKHLTGSLKIFLLDCCPYLTIYRVDDEMYWGLYTSSGNGVNLPLFKTSMKSDPSLYNQLHEHIHAFMTQPKLVNMPEMERPALSRSVADHALN